MKVTASEFQKNFGHFKEVAQREPVTVTSNGRISVVLISATEYGLLTTLRREQGAVVSEGFKGIAAERAEIHKDVLDGLSR